MPLQEYKELVATAAGITTIAQFFSPIFICKKIVQNGSSKGVDPMPFIGGLGMAVLFLEYGLILNDPAMIPVNIFGFVLNIAYAICYYLYTTEKGEIIRTKSVESLPFPMILSGSVVSSLWFLYAIIIENLFMQVQNAVGLVLCLIQLSLFAIYPSSPSVKAEEKKKK